MSIQACCVPLCGNTNDKFTKEGKYYDGRYIQFPRDAVKKEKWRKSLELSFVPKVKDLICSEHFPDDAWKKQDILLSVPLINRRLTSNAVPVLKKVSSTKAEKSSEISMSPSVRKSLVAEALQDYEKKNEQEKYDHYLKDLKRKKFCHENFSENPTEAIVHPTKPSSILTDTSLSHNFSLLKREEEAEVPLEDLNISKKVFKKCAEVILDVEDFNFRINCSHCENSWEEMKEFIDHVKEQHQNLLEISKDLQEKVLAVKQQPKLLVSEIYPKTPENCSNLIEVLTISTDSIDLEDFTLIHRIISLWKRNPLLWDKSHSDYNLCQERTLTIYEIVKQLNQKSIQTSISPLALQVLLKQMTSAYQKDYEKFKNLTEMKQNSFKPKYWFFNELNFLRSHIENDYTDDQKMQIALKLPLSLETLGKESLLIDIIEMYETFKALWDVYDSNYQGKLLNLQEFSELFQQVQKMQVDQIPILVENESELFTFLHCFNEWFIFVKHFKENTNSSRSFSCPFPFIYEALSFLDNHFAPFRCNFCQQIYTNEQSFLKHTTETPNSCSNIIKGKIFQCKFCNKCFAKEANLTSHVRQHTDERPYECKLCGKCFRNYPTWYRHKRIHTKLKPYQCETCQKCFYTQGLLNHHRKSHLNIRDKVCDICGKSFTLTKYLYRHRDVHAEELKHQCHFCDRIFKTKSSLYYHMNRCRTESFKKSQDIDLSDSGSNQVKTIMKVGKVVENEEACSSREHQEIRESAIVIPEHIIIDASGYITFASKVT